MSVYQVFNRSVNRIFLLCTIQNIQPNTFGQISEYHITVETQEGWTDKYGNQKTQTEQHHLVFDQSFAEPCKQFKLGQSMMLQEQQKPNKIVNICSLNVQAIFKLYSYLTSMPYLNSMTLKTTLACHFPNSKSIRYGLSHQTTKYSGYLRNRFYLC